MPNIPGVPLRRVTVGRQVATTYDPSAIGRAAAPYEAVADALNFGSQLIEKEKQEQEAVKLNDGVTKWKKDLILLDDRLRKKNIDTPNGFSALFEEEAKKLKDQYSGTFTDKDTRKLFDGGADKDILSGFSQALTFQRTRGSEIGVEKYNDSIANMNDMVALGVHRGEDPSKILEGMFKQAEGAGVSLDMLGVSGEDRADAKEGAREMFIKTAISAALQGNNPNAANAILEEHREELGTESIKLRDMIKVREKQIKAKATADMKKEKDIVDSRINLAVEVAEGPQALEDVSKEVDKLEPRYGEQWANKKRLGLVKANKEWVKKQEDIINGSLFASGEKVVNIKETKDRRAFDAFYNAIKPEMEELPPAERNAIVTDFISNARDIPDTLKGELEAAALSNNPEELQQAADLINRVQEKAPYLVGRLGSSDAIRRVEMINDRLGSGYSPNEAIEKTDRLLDPATAKEREFITSGLAAITKKTDFAGDTQDLYKEFFFFGRPEAVDVAGREELASAAVVKRVAFEDAYLSSGGDKEQAKKESDRVVKGQFFETKVNGTNQLMRFAPDAYYSIPNVDNEWIRDQVTLAVNDLTTGGLEPLSYDKIQQDARILSDPFVTGEMAVAGTPVYKLMYLSDDGNPVPLLGQDEYFMPDAEKMREHLTKGYSPTAKEEEPLGAVGSIRALQARVLTGEVKREKRSFADIKKAYRIVKVKDGVIIGGDE